MLSREAEAEVLIADDADEAARFTAELVARAALAAVETRGRARIALSGGTTPIAAYRALGGMHLPWSNIELFQVDERAGPRGAPRSNHASIEAALADTTGKLQGGGVCRMGGEAADLADAAADYERALRASFGVACGVRFDAVVLGIGEDGHTASLFPGTGAVAIDDRLVAATRAPGGLEPRVTLTRPVLTRARLLVLLATGDNKRDAVARARDAVDTSDVALDAVPSRLVHASEGQLVWVLDRAAAGPG